MGKVDSPLLVLVTGNLDNLVYFSGEPSWERTGLLRAVLD